MGSQPATNYLPKNQKAPKLRTAQAKPNHFATASPAIQSIIELLLCSGWLNENSEIFDQFQKYRAIDLMSKKQGVSVASSC